MLFWVFGCSDTTNLNVKESSQVTIGNPTAQEVLQIDSEADIFQWDGTIFKTNIDWVNELVLTEGELIGVIEYNISNPVGFKDATANILPIGTEIYKVKERNDVLMAKNNGILKYYYQLVEG